MKHANSILHRAELPKKMQDQLDKAGKAGIVLLIFQFHTKWFAIDTEADRYMTIEEKLKTAKLLKKKLKSRTKRPARRK